MYYPDFKGVPDFGKLSGIEPYKQETNKYFYKYNNDQAPHTASMDYGYLFADLGYTTESSSSEADKAEIVLVNQVMNLKVILSEETLSDEESILIIEIIK